jgi:hypothetical protein
LVVLLCLVSQQGLSAYHFLAVFRLPARRGRSAQSATKEQEIKSRQPGKGDSP